MPKVPTSVLILVGAFIGFFWRVRLEEGLMRGDGAWWGVGGVWQVGY